MDSGGRIHKFKNKEAMELYEKMSKDSLLKLTETKAIELGKKPIKERMGYYNENIQKQKQEAMDRYEGPQRRDGVFTKKKRDKVKDKKKRKAAKKARARQR